MPIMTIDCPLALATKLIAAHVLVIAASLGLWYWTQWLLAQRKPAAQGAEAQGIADGIHRMTASINRRLNNHPRDANALLISSSLVIDLLGCYLLGSAILGSTLQPFLGLLILYATRQICQAFCPLPLPPGMIWRKPGFPTLFVTYGTSNDLFFSGHTALAVYGAATLATALGPAGIVMGCLIVFFEIAAVLLLRAHYTMDVFAGAIMALYAHRLAIDWAPTIDGWVRQVLTLVS